MRQRRTARVCAAAVATLTALVGAVVGAGPAAALSDPVRDISGTCPAWQVGTVASGYGMLENLAFDGDGNLLLSETGLFGEGTVQQLSAKRERSVFAADVPAPGGLVVGDDEVYVTTGNSALPGLLGSADGALLAVDRGTRQVRTVAEGLVMPNGLARLPGGDFVVTRNIDGVNGGSGLTRVSPGVGGAPASVSPYAPLVRNANGAAVDADRGHLVVSTSFEPETRVHIVDLDEPGRAPRTFTLPGAGTANLADDLAVADDGAVYVAMFGTGQVVRLDPATGRSCVVAAKVPFVTAVEFGSGPGWDSRALYATSYDGTVRKLTPPPAR